MMKGKNVRPGFQLIFLTGYCNVSACVRQHKGIITILQVPTITPNFLQLKNVRLHSSKHGVLQYFLEAKHHQQLAYIGRHTIRPVLASTVPL